MLLLYKNLFCLPIFFYLIIFGNYVIELDKKILEDRKDFYIREAFNEYNFNYMVEK